MIIRAPRGHQLIRFFFIALALALGLMCVQAQVEATTRGIEEVFNRYADELQRLAKTDFGSKEMAELNYRGAASISAIPPPVSPVERLSELEAGRTIGALVLATGSDRLKLPAGIFRVFVLKKNGLWTVQFYDARERIVGEAPASVTEAPRVSTPSASLDHSVCVRFDQTLVCY